MTHKGTVTLETERLILRRFILEDAEAMFCNWASDPEVTKFLMWQTHADIEVSKTITNEWVENYKNNRYYQWAIVPKYLGKPIGSIAAVKVDDAVKMVHIGYAIGARWWHQGYTSEALTRLVSFFFKEVGVNRIESRHDPRNPNSGKVMLKAGLKYEGILKRSDYNNQGICDAAYYAILAEEYFSNTQTVVKSIFIPTTLKISIGDLSIDCANPVQTRDFYAALTGWEIREAYGCPAVVNDKGLLILFMGCDFDYTPPIWPEESGKQQKQMHFNFQVDNLPGAVEKAIQLGAVKATAQYGGEHFVTMIDPEGHPFCLCRK